MTPGAESTRDTRTVSALGRALVIVGDAWSVRVVRSVFVGHRRFGDLRDALGISEPVLSRRLSSLVTDGILVRSQDGPGAPRSEYLLTDEGKNLWRVMVAIWSWDQTWAGSRHPDAGIVLRHHACGQVTRPVFGCGACGAIGLTARDVAGHADDLLLRDVKATNSRRPQPTEGPIGSSRVLGDHWATLVLSCALMGDKHFQEFQRDLGISPGTLTSRLAFFVDAGILVRGSQRLGAKRQVYRLTPRGLDFFAVAAMINDWARQWLSDDGYSGLSLVHRACGDELVPQLTCNFCNEVLERAEVNFRGANLEGVRDRAGHAASFSAQP